LQFYAKAIVKMSVTGREFFDGPSDSLGSESETEFKEKMRA
jgi:hypothetical protein